jgi:hypothetical protein
MDLRGIVVGDLNRAVIAEQADQHLLGLLRYRVDLKDGPAGGSVRGAEVYRCPNAVTLGIVIPFCGK